MRLFWKEHIPLLLCWFLQLSLMTGVFWMVGNPSASILTYFALLSISVLIGYLGFRFLSHYRFYFRLSRSVETLNESIEKTGDSPLPEALDGLLQSQYRLYQQKLYQYERGRRDYITFINQWVHQMKTPLSVMDLMLQEETAPRFDPSGMNWTNWAEGWRRYCTMSGWRYLTGTFKCNRYNLALLFLK